MVILIPITEVFTNVTDVTFNLANYGLNRLLSE